MFALGMSVSPTLWTRVNYIGNCIGWIAIKTWYRHVNVPYKYNWGWQSATLPFSKIKIVFFIHPTTLFRLCVMSVTMGITKMVINCLLSSIFLQLLLWLLHFIICLLLFTWICMCVMYLVSVCVGGNGSRRVLVWWHLAQLWIWSLTS